MCADAAGTAGYSSSIAARAAAIFRPRVGIDWRALAAFRMGLGIVLLADLLLIRGPELGTFYTDNGVFPRTTLAAEYPLFARLSLHALSGSLWLQVLLTVVAGVAALSLLCGYSSRLATAASLCLLASLHTRNPLLINGGDVILLSLLLCAIFLPLGRRWSIDAHRRSAQGDEEATEQARPATATSTTLSLPTVTILSFVVLVYATNAVFKLRSEPWMDGTAVPQIFQVEHFIIGIGPLLTAAPTLLEAINWLWIALLCLSVFLLVLTGWRRTALLASFVGAQLGMALTMRLGLFPIIMLTGLILFVPPAVWDRLEAGIRRVGLERVLEDGYTRLQATPLWRVTRPPSMEAPTIPPVIRRGVDYSRSAVVACILLGLVGSQAIAVGAVAPPEALSETEPADYGLTLFAPHPPSTTGWYVVAAELDSGEQTDPLQGQPLEWGPPSDAADRYPTTLWNRYLGEVRGADDRQYEPFASWLCERPDTEVSHLTISYIEQPVGPNGPDGEATTHERFEYTC